MALEEDSVVEWRGALTCRCGGFTFHLVEDGRIVCANPECDEPEIAQVWVLPAQDETEVN